MVASSHRRLASPHRELFYLGLALLGIALALVWVGGLPGSAQAAALLPPLCALLLWWGVGRVERHAGMS